jgi:hypothetical protein
MQHSADFPQEYLAKTFDFFQKDIERPGSSDETAYGNKQKKINDF